MIARVRLDNVRRTLLRLTADLLILAGVSGVLVWAWAMSEGALYQYVQEAHFAGEAAGAAGEGARPRPKVVIPNEVPRIPSLKRILPTLARTLPRDPQVIGRLEAPSVHLSVMVREGIDNETLRKAVGRLPSSALPGEPGNLVVLGHRDTFFRPLRGIERGHSIRFHTLNGQFEYVVESVEVMEPEGVPESVKPESVKPESANKAESGSDAVTTLITCFPFDYVGDAPRRFVVRARLVTAESHSLKESL